jgi:AP2-associated kinase
MLMTMISTVIPLSKPKKNQTKRETQVENVLLTRNTFKLCDFGSCTTKTYFPQTSSEMSRAEDDINRNTTMSYRSPEMLDLYRHQLINEKADIWVCFVSPLSPSFQRFPFSFLSEWKMRWLIS